MFGNLVNIHDVSLFIEKARQGRLADILCRIVRHGSGAAGASWDHVDYPLKNWWDIPEVMERWNAMVSGDPKVDYFAYFFRKYLAGRSSMRALSLGCGTGHREVDLARSGAFERIDAVDISKARVAYSMQRAKESGFGGSINYIAGDAADVGLPMRYYDVVIVEQFLHHVSRLERLLARIEDFLKPDGRFIFNEFVGPSRFQWTRKQLDAVNALLRQLPEKYRVRLKSGTIKRAVHRPGKLGMLLYDRTEAVQSSRIVALVEGKFEILERKGYGGAVLQLLFGDIASNFLSKDPETRGYLRRCFEIEDSLLERGEIASDFLVGICARRGAAAR